MGLGRRGPSDEERPRQQQRGRRGDGEKPWLPPAVLVREPSSELWKKVFSGIALAGRKPPETKAKLALAGTRARDSFRVGSFRLI
ncbi:unnamed protein product [Spirodela intermedia]|uniref:Uncharacterized protein n=1 Tax=Spirodela intermedia TaxID=51605 RepID=A0A7I8I7S2_SPIIN|nr:unnamed protein product [Spirodela intermedia]CAA6653676.1 unnamed protein product [Spirodela intermedia]